MRFVTPPTAKWSRHLAQDCRIATTPGYSYIGFPLGGSPQIPLPIHSRYHAITR
jgi:hypothetical protein